MLHAFDPVETKDSSILILGTLPSKESLRIYEYYDHPRNAFWFIMAAGFFGINRELADYGMTVRSLTISDSMS